MAHLPLANLLHHKLRSVLSALGIALAVCMLLTLSGLARGSLYEIADRWDSVDADLIVYPRVWGDNVATLSGAGLSDREADDIRGEHGQILERIVPVFLWRVQIARQYHVVVGVDSDGAHWRPLTAGRPLVAGRWCDEGGTAAGWLEREMMAEGDENDAPLEAGVLERGLAERGGLEMVIDERLAGASGLGLGDTVRTAGHDWTVVGITPKGVLARAFIPRRTAQLLFGAGSIRRSTLMFVKLREGVDRQTAARAVANLRREVLFVQQYRGMLEQRFGVMFRYVDMVNALALGIAFLFIMVTLYTMVLQRTREIAILKSCGASNAFIVRQVMTESLLLTGAGLALGVGLAFAAAWGIERLRPLITVTITGEWILIGAAAAVVGAAVSALYPAYRATRVNVSEALTLE